MFKNMYPILNGIKACGDMLQKLDGPVYIISYWCLYFWMMLIISYIDSIASHLFTALCR
jgi:hypothetical protein